MKDALTPAEVALKARETYPKTALILTRIILPVSIRPTALDQVCTSISSPSASATRERMVEVTSVGVLRPEPEESAEPKMRLSNDCEDE